MHKTIEPTILYFGTPVALISTLNPDGSPNLAPPDYELLPIFRARRRGAPIASGGIRLHEVRGPGNPVATEQFFQFTAADVMPGYYRLSKGIDGRSIWSSDAKAGFHRLQPSVL